MTALLDVRGLEKTFQIAPGWFGARGASVSAVAGVDLSIAPGETLGLVGESGCGKSTVSRLVLGLMRPTAGVVTFAGRELPLGSGRKMRAVRRDLQVVFQDPYASLNPRMTAGDIVAEPLRNYRLARHEDGRDRVADLFEQVGLRADQMSRFPHEFSGGQRQRIGIARALALSPRLIVADEPVSALDVSVQAQLLNLFRTLQRRRGLSYLFVAHDLAVVQHVSHRVAVMYLGCIVETAPRRALFGAPRHPYTRALLASAPRLDPGQRASRTLLAGEAPSPLAAPSGCRFHTRCPLVADICRRERPPLADRGEGHLVACHFA